jgi:hypothetical protein
LLSIVASMDEVIKDTHFAARGIFSRTVVSATHAAPALPLPLVEAYRDPKPSRSSPAMPGTTGSAK